MSFTTQLRGSLIEASSRVFGADNAFAGWHIHPFDSPNQHVPSSEVSFEKFLKTIEERIGQR